VSNQTHHSRTDPDATLARKDRTPLQLKYKVHQTIDADSRVILDTHVTTGAVHDSQPYLEQLQRIRRHEIHVREAVADRGYGSAAIIRCLQQQGIETYIPLWSGRVGNSKYLTGDLVYEKENDRFRCPQGKYLTPNPAINENQKRYVSSSEDCRNCPQASTCPARTRGRSIQRFVLRSLDQDLFEEVQTKMRDPTFKQIRKERMWKSEGLFAEAKQNHNLSRAKYRGRPKVQIQALLSAIAQNVKRLVALFYCWLLSHWLRLQTKTADWTASTNTLIDFFNTPVRLLGTIYKCQKPVPRRVLGRQLEVARHDRRNRQNCPRRPFLNRWVDGAFHASMSCWNFLCGAASPETRASRRKHQQQQSRRLGDGGIRSGTRAAAGSLAEAGTPLVVMRRANRAADQIVRQDVVGVQVLAPHNVVGRIGGAILVVVARERRNRSE
jgi:hypothetical protein